MKRLSLAGWMVVAIVLGAAFGWLAPDWARTLAIVSTIFLRLIRSVIAPVLIGVLISSAARAGSAGQLGRLAFKAIIYFELATSAALAIGWIAVWLVQPGRSLHLGTQNAAVKVPDAAELTNRPRFPHQPD